MADDDTRSGPLVEGVRRALGRVLDPEIRKPVTELDMIGDVSVDRGGAARVTVKLTIVGCAGSFPSAESPASCYLIEAPYEGRTYRLVVDLGSGALGALQRYVDLRDVDAVALSHLHPDHCFDLSGLYVVSKYHPAGALPRIKPNFLKQQDQTLWNGGLISEHMSNCIS